jgi:hypothetical protein
MEFSKCSNYIHINACLHKEYLLEMNVLKWTKMQYNHIHYSIVVKLLHWYSNNLMQMRLTGLKTKWQNVYWEFHKHWQFLNLIHLHKSLELIKNAYSLLILFLEGKKNILRLNIKTPPTQLFQQHVQLVLRHFCFKE